MQRLYAVVFCVGKAIEGMAIVLGLMANFVKNLFIDVSLGRTPLLNYDFSRVPLYRSNHRISAVKGLEHECFFSLEASVAKLSPEHSDTGIDKQCDQREQRFPEECSNN